jgi:integrase/recombinase XerD
MSNNSSTENAELTDFAEGTIKQNGTSEDTGCDRPDNDGSNTSRKKSNHTDSSLCSTINDSVEKTIQERPSPEIPDGLCLQSNCKIVTQCMREEAAGTIKISSADEYSSRIRNYRKFLPDENILSADVSDIRTFCKVRARNDRREGTLKVDVSAITKFYQWVLIDTDLDTNVEYAQLDQISASDYQTPEPINREPISREELERLYDCFNYKRDKLMATIAGEVGPRNIDVRKIKVNDIKFEDNRILLNNTKNNREYTQPISDGLAVDLMHYIQENREAWLMSESNEYLFPSQEGGMLSSFRFNEIVKEAAEKAEIQDVIGTMPAECGVNKQTGDIKNLHRVTPHTLRHTFNQLMNEAGIPIEARCDALDQDSVEVNREYYTPDDEEYIRYIRENLHGNNS